MNDAKSARFRWGRAIAALGVVLAVGAAVRSALQGPVVFLPDPPAPSAEGRFAYDVPLDPTSPWAKFRANAVQNGRSPIVPVVDPERQPWEVRTGKGVFSSPVIDAEGTVYIGSADRWFYAIDRDGRVRWKLETGEVIDSSALLDDRGRVYFGSGDARLYAVDRATGEVVWTFVADPVEVVEERYDIDSFNVDWFEGNVGMLEDGTLIAPNDNFLVYAIDRETGRKRAEYLGNELMWSLPAVNVRTGRMFAGSQFLAWRNLYAWDTRTGEAVWTNGGWGSNAASPLLTSRSADGALVVGGYDGFVRAYSQATGRPLWKRGTRDHIYASPAQLSDGTLIQPSTDGTVYALEPTTGEVRWAYDTLGPIRSSPAVDGLDRIYFGNGEGRLYSLAPDGELRWSFQLIDEERNDLNGSPALGPDGVTIAGQNGGVFHVPWDYPLGQAGRRDPRTVLGPGEALAADGVSLLYTEAFGRYRVEPPRTIDANQPLAFTLFVREGGDTRKAAITADDLQVAVTGDPGVRVDVSADGQFFTLLPDDTWVGAEGGEVRVDITGSYRVDPWRFGLKFFGGRRGGSLDASFRFEVGPREVGPREDAVTSPYRVPEEPGDPGSTFVLRRFAAPHPTMLPSWNQIGFDSLHYLAGIVEGLPERSLLWVIAGRPVGGRVVPDPGLRLRFPLVMEADRGLLTLRNDDGFKINFVGSWDMPFDSYRASMRSDPRSGEIIGSAALNAVANANDLEYYGKFLKLLGMADVVSGHMAVFGGLEVDLQSHAAVAPSGVGSVRFTRDARSARAIVTGSRLRADGHVFSLLLVDARTGEAVPLYYTQHTRVETDASGAVSSVTVEFGDEVEIPEEIRAYYLVDTHPAARGRL